MITAVETTVQIIHWTLVVTLVPDSVFNITMGEMSIDHRALLIGYIKPGLNSRN